MLNIPLALLSVPWKSYWLEHKEQMYDRLRGIVSGSGVFTNLVFLLCWHLVLQENGVVVPFEVSFFESTVGILVLIVVFMGGIFLALKPSR